MTCKLDAQLLTECDRVLSKCGRPVAPPGLAYVEIDQPQIVNIENPANTGMITTVEITGPTEWRMRDISVVQSSPAFVRVQLPDGQFLSQLIMALAPNAWSGSFRRAITDDVVAMPGQKLRITTDTSKTGMGASSIQMAFGGVFRFALKSGPKTAGTMAADESRYRRTPNGNLLAPQMVLDDEFAEIPAGWVQSEFRLKSVNPTTNLPTAVLSTPGGQSTLQILLNARYNYSIRRLLFDVRYDDGVSGQLSVIPRDSSGFSLSTDYVPVAQVDNLVHAHNWELPGSLSMFFDFLFQRTAGAGNVTVSVVAVGTRQRRQS